MSNNYATSEELPPKFRPVPAPTESDSNAGRLPSPLLEAEVPALAPHDNTAGGGHCQVVAEIKLFTSTDLAGSWFRVYPGEDARTWVSTLRGMNGELYLVAPEMRPVLRRYLTYGFISTIVTEHGKVALWWTPMRTHDKGPSTWNTSAIEIATTYGGARIKLDSKTSTKEFLVIVDDTDQVPEQEWREVEKETMLAKAFGNKMINNFTHPLVTFLVDRG